MSLQPIIAPIEQRQEPAQIDSVPTSDADADCVALLKGEMDLGKSYKAPEPGGHVQSVLQQMGIGYVPPPPDLQVGDPGVLQDQLAKAELLHKSEHMDKAQFTTRELQERAQKRIDREEMVAKAQQLGGDGYQPGATDRDTAVMVTTGVTAQSFHQVDQDVDSEGDEPEDSIMRREDMVARESQEKYPDYWTNKSEGLDAMGDFLEKAKYTRRTGQPGNYKYFYEGGKTRGGASGESYLTPEGDPTKLSPKTMDTLKKLVANKLDVHGADSSSMSELREFGYVKRNQNGNPYVTKKGKAAAGKPDAGTGMSAVAQKELDFIADQVDKTGSYAIDRDDYDDMGTLTLKDLNTLEEKGYKVEHTGTRRAWYTIKKGGPGSGPRKVTQGDVDTIQAENAESRKRLAATRERIASKKKELESIKKSEGLDAMSDFLEKAGAYTGPGKRTGSPGNYKYDYEAKKNKPGHGTVRKFPENTSSGRPVAQRDPAFDRKEGESMEAFTDRIVALDRKTKPKSGVVGKTKSGKDISRLPQADKYFADWSSVDHANAANFFEGKESVEGHGYAMKNFHNSMMGAKMNEELGHSSFDHKKDADKFRKRARKQVREFQKEEKKVEKSMSEGLDAMGEYLAKSGHGGGLPTGSTMSLKKPKSSRQGGSADGGELAGVGMTSGLGSYPGPGQDSEGQITGTSTGEGQFSDDDAKDEGQMQPHKKPIEKYTRKSMTPAGQRESVAYENALEVARLRKGPADIRVGADQAASELVKSDGFYTGQSPSENMAITPLSSSQKCGGCSVRFSKSLTACPDCGFGQVTHRALPRMFGNRTVNDRQPLLRKGRVEPDVQVAIVTPVQFHNQGGTVKLG